MAGQGAPVVFLHPLLASGLHWRKVVPPVAAAEFRCYTPTLPLGAHDLPMRPDADLAPVAMADLAAEFIRAMDVGPVTLVGNDSGGALTQIVATRHPDLVARAVLTSCDAFEDFFPPLFRYLSWGARVPGFAVAVGQSLRVRALRHTPLTFGWLAKHKIDHAVIDAYARPFLADAAVRRDVVKFIRGVDRKITLDAAEQLRTFDKPVLLAWAREDKVFAPSLATRLAEVLPDARLAWIDDAYAFTPEDQPEVLARLIIDFCSS
jgi:pimeloyl-ACP methyl ester carboxylesterase